MAASAKSHKVTPRRRSTKHPLKDKNTAESPPQQQRTTSKRQKPRKSDPADEESDEIVLEASDRDENDETVGVGSTTTTTPPTPPPPKSGRKRKLSRRDSQDGDDDGCDREGKIKKAMRSSSSSSAPSPAAIKPGAKSTKGRGRDDADDRKGGDDDDNDDGRKAPRSSHRRTRVSSASIPDNTPKKREKREAESQKVTRLSLSRKNAAIPTDGHRDIGVGDDEPKRRKRAFDDDLVIDFDSDSLFTSILTPPRDSSPSETCLLSKEGGAKPGRPKRFDDGDDGGDVSDDNQPRVLLCPRLDDRGKSKCRACQRARERRRSDGGFAPPPRHAELSPRKEIVKTKKSILSALALDFKDDFDDDDDDKKDGFGGDAGGNLFDSIVVDVEACVEKVRLTEEEQRQVEQREKEAEKARKRKERERLKAEKEAAKREEMERKRAIKERRGKEEKEKEEEERKEREREEKARKEKTSNAKAAPAETKLGGRKSGDRRSGQARSSGDGTLTLDNAEDERFQPFVILSRNDCKSSTFQAQGGSGRGGGGGGGRGACAGGTPTKVKKLANGKLSFEVPKRWLSPGDEKHGIPTHHESTKVDRNISRR